MKNEETELIIGENQNKVFKNRKEISITWEKENSHLDNISLIKAQCKVLTLRSLSLNLNNGFALLTT